MKALTPLLILSLLTFHAIADLHIAYCSLPSNIIVVPDDADSIQKAIDLATEGQKILVKTGIYKECILIDKPLTIIGEEGAEIVGSGRAHTVQIRANNVHFSGFTIRGKIDSSFSGIHVFYSSSCIIENNKVTDHYCGIQLYDSSNNTLKNNHMAGNYYNLEVWGLVLDHFIHKIDTTNYVNQKKVYFLVNKHWCQVSPDAGYVALVNCSNILVKDSVIAQNGEGVLIAYTKNSLIYNVTSIKNKRGIRLTSSSNNEIFECNLSNNSWVGVVIEASNDNLVHDCTISKNVKGIILSESNILNKASFRNTIAHNNISQNTYGAWLSFSPFNEFRQNCFVDNYHNIELSASHNNIFYGNTLAKASKGMSLSNSENNTIYSNNFLNNTIQAYIEDLFSKNLWDNPSIGGNYWSDYSGIDNDCNGIGDVPYIVNANNKDHYPLMKPWTVTCDARVTTIIPYPTEVYEEQVVNIKVVIHYQGDDTGTLTVKCKFRSEDVEHLIGTQIVMNAFSDTKVTLSFTWTPKNIALYEIKAEILSLDNETDITNNVKVSILMVKVKKIGDVNGDQVIDMKDMALAALSFGSRPEHPRWNLQADLNQDQKIDLKDLAIIAKNFG
ncbi:MAG: NosD domain-containing protein [Candidatus Bathyarchaeia archaeon]